MIILINKIILYMEGNRFRENNNILNPMGAKETKFNCPNAFISSDRRNFQSFG
jgi:hypothetical protein